MCNYVQNDIMRQAITGIRLYCCSEQAIQSTLVALVALLKLTRTPSLLCFLVSTSTIISIRSYIQLIIKLNMSISVVLYYNAHVIPLYFQLGIKLNISIVISFLKFKQ